MGDNWDKAPHLVAARLGVRDPAEALGHQDVRHDVKHRMLRFPPEHVMDGHESDERFRCTCRGPFIFDRSCCARMDGEDLLCAACRTLDCTR